MKQSYDLLIAGGGPCGSIAAKTAAEAGLSVLLAEKRSAIGVPIRSAEAIERKNLEEFIEADRRWISAYIRKAEIKAPNGKKITITGNENSDIIGYVTNRKNLDKELALRAVNAGADAAVRARVSAPITENGKICGAEISQNGKTYKVRAKIVIAADGIESKFAKWAGINTTLPINDISSCMQYYVTGIDVDETKLTYCISSAYAPGGFIWIFPKSSRSANIGVSISGSKTCSGYRAKDCLDKFIQKHYPGGKILEITPGGVPASKPLRCMAADGLMIAGDAARLTDPMTGRGMYNAMYSGRLSAQTAVLAIKKGDTSKKFLMNYDRALKNSIVGMTLERDYAIKEIFQKLDDEKISSLISSMPDTAINNISIKDIAGTVIRANPWIISEIPKILKYADTIH